ncbi:MAG: hypothetical protein Ct9H300mP32_6200 [Verrucomicrobiota bacterium]|nr:MAG: hypothetical protein Ct9H300mP32_6200 [Verrucomicrobiota bacterium]
MESSKAFSEKRSPGPSRPSVVCTLAFPCSHKSPRCMLALRSSSRVYPLAVAPRRISRVIDRDERPRKNERQQQQCKAAQQQQQQVRGPPLAVQTRGLGLVKEHQAAKFLLVFRPVMQQVQDKRDGQAKRAQQVKRGSENSCGTPPGRAALPDKGAPGRSSRKKLQYPLERLGGRHAEPRDTLRAENRVERGDFARCIFF